MRELSVRFERLDEVEVLLKLAMTAKFESGPGREPFHDLEIFQGSEVLCRALTRLRDALLEEVEAAGVAGEAARLRQWYLLSSHQHRWQLIADRAKLLVDAKSPGEAELANYIRYLASPLVVDESSMKSVRDLMD